MSRSKDTVAKKSKAHTRWKRNALKHVVNNKKTYRGGVARLKLAEQPKRREFSSAGDFSRPGRLIPVRGHLSQPATGIEGPPAAPVPGKSAHWPAVGRATRKEQHIRDNLGVCVCVFVYQFNVYFS